MRVRLTEQEIEFLSSHKSLSLPRREEFLEEGLRRSGIRTLDLLDKEAAQLRESCIEMLQRCGFDENYNPTKAGIVLESLIDKLYFE